MASGGGRPKSSGVWSYFRYDKINDKSVCDVKTNDGSVCGKEFKGQYPTNLKKHLKTSHSDEYKCFEAAEIEKTKEKERKGSSRLKQSTLPVCGLGSKSYDIYSRKHKAITFRLATFICASNVPLALVDNSEFRGLIEELDPRYSLPHQNKMESEIEKIYQNSNAKVSESLGGATKISICADIWSKPGMTASFLGITAHYLSSNDNQRHTVTLAVCNLPSPHTAERISNTVDNILREWNLPRHHIFRILTDNSSNMVAAFKNRLLDHSENTNEENVELGTATDSEVNNSLESEDEGDCEDLDSISDVEFDSDNTISSEISNFEQTEIRHNEAFTGMSFKRISCFIHTFQLVVKVFETNPSFRNSLQKAHSIVKKVNKSCKATEKLIRIAGKKTYW